MKKVWANAEIESLEINQTAGGTILDNTVDGQIWWSEDKGEWEAPLGHEPGNS